MFLNKHKKTLLASTVTWSPSCHHDSCEAGLDVELVHVIVSVCPALTVDGLRLMFSDLGGTAQKSQPLTVYLQHCVIGRITHLARPSVRPARAPKWKQRKNPNTGVDVPQDKSNC